MLTEEKIRRSLDLISEHKKVSRWLVDARAMAAALKQPGEVHLSITLTMSPGPTPRLRTPLYIPLHQRTQMRACIEPVIAALVFEIERVEAALRTLGVEPPAPEKEDEDDGG